MDIDQDLNSILITNNNKNPVFDLNMKITVRGSSSNIVYARSTLSKNKRKTNGIIDIKRLSLIDDNKIKKPSNKYSTAKKAYQIRNRMKVLAGRLENHENDVFLVIVSKRGNISGHISKRYRDCAYIDTKAITSRTNVLSSNKISNDLSMSYANKLHKKMNHKQERRKEELLPHCDKVV